MQIAKITTYLLLLLAPLSLQAFETVAKNAYVIDVSTGNVMLDKSSDISLPPASTSKLMTIALLFKSLKEGKLTLDSKFSVSKKAWEMGGSKMFVEVNSQVSVEDLIQGILVQSGNDACVVVAEGLAGTEENFAQQMNAYATELGLTNSRFGNASGWPHPNQRMSAKDLATLAYYLYQNYPEYWHYFAEPEFTYNKITQQNRNPLIGAIKGADGLKTGHTQESGYSLVGSVARDDRRVIIVLMGMQTEAERAAEAERVATWALTQFVAKTQYKSGDPITTAKTWLGDKPEVTLTTSKDFTTLLPIDGSQTVNVKAVFSEPIPAPISQGDEVGYLEVEGTNLTSYRIPLIAAESVEKGGLASRLSQVISNGVSSKIPSQAESAN